MKKLYGNGINDDTQAIQERIDKAKGELILPMPKKCYIISKPLELPSNFKLELPRFAEIKLADHSDCVMLKNKTKAKEPVEAMDSLWAYLGVYDENYPCENIEVVGGIWNCNNMNQRANPIWMRFREEDAYRNAYNGFGMLFYNVRNITIRSLTMKDPVTFAITLDKATYFTVEDIKFDFNFGNPIAGNMDGVHVNGNSHYGYIRNLMGTCHDDLVALNADEGTCGPITNVDISGIYSEDCHSAVRLLCKDANVENVHIHDVFGTYYQYCVGVTKFYPGDATGHFAGITIDNIYASKASLHDICYEKDGETIYPLRYKEVNNYVFSPIYISEGVRAKDLTISNIHRKEEKLPVQTIWFEKGSCCEKVSIYDVHTENKTGKPMPVIVNDGTIDKLFTERIMSDDEILINNGIIKERL